MIKTFKQAYDYLKTHTDYERMAKYHYSQKTFNLKRMESLLDKLGRPQQGLRFIHIAGTKGKGSTAIITARILSASGYKTGLFTSPHLINITERIQIDGASIPNSIFARLMNDIRIASRNIKGLTFFELITAMAFLYFRDNRVDFAVIEVGLGGRLDSTNVITPLASIITRLDFDHMDKLGNTISRIAREKAGIIKPGVPVITIKQQYQDAMRVIRDSAIKNKSPLYVVQNKTNRPYPAPLILGQHQNENIGLALEVIKLLNLQGYINVESPKIKSALKGLRLPGRIEIISHRPGIIIDSAHNPVAMEAVRDTVVKLDHRKLILVIGISMDKDIPKMLDIIMPISDTVIFTSTKHPRLLAPIDFTPYLKESYLERPIFLDPDYRRAMRLAKHLANKNDLILVTGSFYLAGEVLKSMGCSI
ncbi:MAG: folylpolyglutamate synthase/dihydrofolate synthase family protein [Candidatus Brocadiia bacterium]